MFDIKAILFDLDGVLVDTCDLHYAAFNMALQEVCNYTLDKKDHAKRFNGKPTKAKLYQLVDENVIQVKDIERISDLKQNYTKVLIEREIHPDYHITDLLTYLKKNQIKLGCVTNSIGPTTLKMLDKANIAHDLFDIIVTNELGPHKPNPFPYMYAMSKLDVAPTNTLIVEDSKIGSSAAFDSEAKVFVIPHRGFLRIDLFRDYLLCNGL